MRLYFRLAYGYGLVKEFELIFNLLARKEASRPFTLLIKIVGVNLFSF